MHTWIVLLTAASTMGLALADKKCLWRGIANSRFAFFTVDEPLDEIFLTKPCVWTRVWSSSISVRGSEDCFNRCLRRWSKSFKTWASPTDKLGITPSRPASMVFLSQLGANLQALHEGLKCHWTWSWRWARRRGRRRNINRSKGKERRLRSMLFMSRRLGLATSKPSEGGSHTPAFSLHSNKLLSRIYFKQRV